MRLGQLARKLEVKPSDIVGYLATKNIQIEENTNTKLVPEYVTQVLNYYGARLNTEHVPDTEVSVADASDGNHDTTGGISDEVAQPSPALAVEDKPQETEIIKAPKIELTGLKVLGKIELPEPKKKQTDVPLENDSSTPLEEPREVRRDKRNSFENRKPRPQKNAIALKREQEAMEAKRKKEEELKLQKERRTQNYLKKVKAHQPTKAARLLRENTIEMSAQELAEQPKTWWGRFMRWLTT